MSSPPDALPRELLFADTDLADADRMNLMTGYIYAQIRSVLALKPDYQAAIDQLKAIGLDRINAILTPVLLQGQQDGATLAQLAHDWTTGTVLTDLKAAIDAEIAGDIATVNTSIAAAVASIAALQQALSLAVPSNSVAGQILIATADPHGPKWGALPMATANDVLAGTSSILPIPPSAIFGASASVATPYASTVTLNFAAGLHFHMAALTGPCLFANPSGMKSGQSGSIKIPQDATGSRVATWGSFWKFSAGAPVLTTTANAYDVVYWLVRDASTIECSINKALS